MLSTKDLLNSTLASHARVLAPCIDALSDLMDDEQLILAGDLAPPAGQINSPLRRAHFFAQVLYESRYLQNLSEDLNYTAQRIEAVFPAIAARRIELSHRPQALGNAAYADRFGNGPELSGDGFRFRGRGFLGHTFRDNYRELAKVLNVDLIGAPELLAQPVNAAKAAAYYFVSRGCLPMADKDDIEATTHAINGGSNGLEARTKLKDYLLKKLNQGET